MVECPICGQSVVETDINTHIDKCLLGETNESNDHSFPKKNDISDDLPQPLSSSQSDESKTPKSLGQVLGKRKRTPTSSSKTEKTKSQRSISMVFTKQNMPLCDDIDPNVTCQASVNSKEAAAPTVTSFDTLRTPFHSFLNTTGKAKTEDGIGTQSKFNFLSDSVPLAEKMRPQTLEEYVGQSKALSSNSTLLNLIKANEIPSLLLWGPPGCGKTTLANIIGCNCKNSGKARFKRLSATSGSVADAKEVIKQAKNDLIVLKRKTVLFLDEIHRFNKLQQDTFLPHVENGTIVLIGATTENPSFHINNALLSRCKVIVFDKLTTDDVKDILLKSLTKLGMSLAANKGDDTLTSSLNNHTSDIQVHYEAIKYLAQMSDGDARIALNGLEMVLRSLSLAICSSSTADKGSTVHLVTSDMVKDAIQRSHIHYDKKEDHFNMISALQKSIRGNDDNAALYWLARMLEGGDNPLYIARRLIRISSEDVGLADPKALQLAVSAYQACHFIGMPECDVILAEAAVYLARAPKSFEVYGAYERIKNEIKVWEGPLPGVPLHLRNAPTKLMKDLGYGSGYKHEGGGDQTYLPVELQGRNFFDEY